MAVLKNKTQGNFTIVSQNIMRDRNLTLTERGMLLTLLSLPDNWHLTIKGLAEILPDGRDKIANTLNSLIEKGYVTRGQSRGERGKFDSTDLEVHEEPIVHAEATSTEEDDHEKTMIKSDSSPCTEKPYTVNPDTEKPCTENPAQYSNNISNNHISINNKVCKTGTLSESEYDKLVTEFGRDNVDYQIGRIRDRGYKGCLNFETISKWCRERMDRSPGDKDPGNKKGSFFNFQQRTYSTDYFEDLQKKIFAN